jgi:coproporphyrinogen III oxidase
MTDIRTAQERWPEYNSAHQAVTLENLSALGTSSQTDPLWKIAQRNGSPALPPLVIELFLSVRNFCRGMFVAIEGSDEHLSIKPWTRDPAKEKEIGGGGGVMSLLRGQCLEKAAVNMSVVWGPKYPALEGKYAGQPYVAGGVSLICHPLNPYAPIAHMNIRYLSVGEGAEAVHWIGGGGDLTPMVRFEEDSALFHGHMKLACQGKPQADYEHFRKWCDEYFFIPHRGETRGIGGIFFDYLEIKSQNDLSLILDVGQEFVRAYGEILARRVAMPFDEALKEQHLYWRGRYAEFNLAYDRGTRFGLLSGGNTEAIFASLPPVVKW